MKNIFNRIINKTLYLKMPRCVNDEKKNFKGNELSPLGDGYSATGFEVGKVMKGHDENLWFVKRTKDNKIWNKINFSKLSKDCYTTAFIPVYQKKEDNIKETGLEEKFGGNVPFFMEGETWPTFNNEPMVFICQFKDKLSKKNELIRLFLPINNEDAMCELSVPIHASRITMSPKNLSNQIFIENNGFSYDTYIVFSWKAKKELKTYDYIQNKIGFENNDLLFDMYHEHELAPNGGVKVLGTPIYTQYSNYTVEKPKDTHLLQIEESELIPYQWGDAGIAHLHKSFYFYWDCC